MKSEWDRIAIQKLSEYISIRTVNPNAEYDLAASFICEYAREIGLDSRVLYLEPKQYPAVIVSWKSDYSPNRSVLLNSHMDVVPVEGQQWSTDPFVLYRSEDGKLFGRGTQDMKAVAIQQIEAVRRLKQVGVKLPCDLHLSFVPDEEVGGSNGMRGSICMRLRKSQSLKEFLDLNVCIALDEGIPSPNDAYALYTEERLPLWLKVRLNSIGGHGSLPAFPYYAMERFQRLYAKLTELRTPYEGVVANDDIGSSRVDLGRWTTVNCTQVQAGVQCNIIPSSVEAMFDIRVPQWRYCEVLKKATEVIEEEKAEIVGEIDEPEFDHSPKELKEELQNLVINRLHVEKPIFSAAFLGSTDSRYLRKIGICCIGFTPMANTPVKLHEADEFCFEAEFLNGIEVMKTMVTKVCEFVGRIQKC
ncbi:hypothetical protein ACOME3_004841 [Neoechinorhynchus agilis]